MVVAALFANNLVKDDPDEMLVRHIILNSLRATNKKFRDAYGEMYIACDHGSWRKDYFPEYKACRKKTKDKNAVDWTRIFEIMGKIQAELIESTPWHVVDSRMAEADDVIAVLVDRTCEFGQQEPVMIVSNDKDFIQLQKHKHVKQWGPNKKGMVSHPDPVEYMMEHVLRGDTGDGVPNVLSSDDSLSNDDKRQSTLFKKKVEEWKKEWDNLENVMPAAVYRNFQRNLLVVNLEHIPKDITEAINLKIDNLPRRTNMKILNYLIKNRCAQLIDSVNDFRSPLKR